MSETHIQEDRRIYCIRDAYHVFHDELDLDVHIEYDVDWVSVTPDSTAIVGTAQRNDVTFTLTPDEFETFIANTYVRAVDPAENPLGEIIRVGLGVKWDIVDGASGYETMDADARLAAGATITAVLTGDDSELHTMLDDWLATTHESS